MRKLGLRNRGILGHLAVEVMLLFIDRVSQILLLLGCCQILECAFNLLCLWNHTVARFLLQSLGIEIIKEIIGSDLGWRLRHLVDIFGLQSVLVQSNFGNILSVSSKE